MSKDPLRCPNCKAGQMIRVHRAGYWEQKILSIFGFYPWSCDTCRFRQQRWARGPKTAAAD